MTKEEADLFAYLVEVLGKSEAERRIFVTIARESGIPDLEARLAKYRATPEYKSALLRYQNVARQLQVQSTAESLAQLIQQLHEGEPLN